MPLTDIQVFEAFNSQMGRFKWGYRDCFNTILALVKTLDDPVALEQAKVALDPYLSLEHKAALIKGVKKNPNLFELYKVDLFTQIERFIEVPITPGIITRKPGDILLLRGNAILINNAVIQNTRRDGPLIAFVDLDHSLKAWSLLGLRKVSGGGTPISHWRLK